MAKMEALKKQQAKESIKLAYALVELENLRKEVHFSQSDVASMRKLVETFDAHQKLAAEALKKIDKENVALKAVGGEVGLGVSCLTKKVEMGMREVESTGSEVEKRYIANFHLAVAYQSFSKC